MLETVWSFLSTWWWIALVVLIFPFSKIIFGWVMIGDNENGVVIRKWGGGNLPAGRIIATKGEAGIWAKMLDPGLKFWYWPWMYEIQKVKVTEIPKDSIGVVEAIDGNILPQGSILATKIVECNSFQEGEKFLENGGIKGYQRNYLANGFYRINTELFKVSVVGAIDIPTNKIGIITTKDGKPLPEGAIAGSIVKGNNKFQDADAFLKADGFRGVQEEVLLAGRYYINTAFADIEIVDMYRVHVGFVGVVNSFIGEKGEDVSGDDFKHGNIVLKGQKGIWKETLDPGLYAINPKLQEVLPVPTTNIVLNWSDDAEEQHGLDKGLKTINLRSKDGFSFDLKASQIINISSKAAPQAIARFGTIENLVAQVLEPTIGNYFRNSAQTSDALNFVDGRKQRQEEARDHINAVLNKYDIVGVDTLIGDINPPKELMKILSDRKVAEQQQEMYSMQEKSEQKRQEFVKAKTAADKEEHLTSARYDKDIAEQNANAKVETAKGDRESAKITADGEAYVLTTVGTAKADNISKVGTAEAEVIKKKTDAMGQQQFAVVQVAEHLAKNNIEIVPKILIQGSEGGNSGLVEALIGTELLKNPEMFAKNKADAGTSGKDTNGSGEDRKKS